MNITPVEGFRCTLGEGPLWDGAEQALYLTDVLARRIGRFHPASESWRVWTLPETVSALALRETGGAILALRQGIHLFDFDTGRLTQLGDPEADRPITQWNDGKADRAGRFVTGTVATDQKSPCCGLYSVDRGAIRRLDDGFTITNGPCWSPDGRVFYWADSTKMTIYAYDYDMRTGGVGNRRLFANTASLGGIPDGATVDTEGRVWSAICGGGVIACYAADGALLRTIGMPTRLVSSVMFGGPALDRLFVTSIDVASLPFDTGHVAQDAWGGALFVIDGLGAAGLPEPRYRG